jgi:hypothetical protein
VPDTDSVVAASGFQPTYVRYSPAEARQMNTTQIAAEAPEV